MIERNTGGPAFPVTTANCIDEYGMTLRDYFAAKAMHAILSNPDYSEEDYALANAAYNVADAMLEVRK